MAPSIGSAFSTFIQSLAGIGVSLLTAIMGVCYAFIALGRTIFAGIVQLGQSVAKLGRDCYTFQSVLFMLKAAIQDLTCSKALSDSLLVRLALMLSSCILSFITSTANFFVILFLGGGYYWYTQTQQGRRVKTNLKGRKA
jgi:hypothetical protein